MNKILGVMMMFKLGERAVEIWPVRLKDWSEFSLCVNLFRWDRLHKIFTYPDASEVLAIAFKILTRGAEHEDLLNNMTQLDYSNLRQLIIDQNDLNFDELFGKDKDAKGKTQEDLY